MTDACIAPAFYVCKGKPGGSVGIIKFLGAVACGPLRTEARDASADLIAVDAVTTFVRTSARSIFNAASRDSLCHNRSKLTDAVIFPRLADIERLVVNGLRRSFEHAKNSRCDVAYVYDRPPGRAIALDIDSTCRMR